MSKRSEREAGPSEVTVGDSPRQHTLLFTLERLLSIEAIEVETALTQASDLVAEALGAEKVDVFLYDPSINSLVAIGVSHTPMGKRQIELGLDRMPLANGGRSVQVFQTGVAHMENHVERDLGELPGIREELGVRSVVTTPMYVAGELRGVIQVDSDRSDAFTEYDLRFVQAVSDWIGTIAHRAELAENMRKQAQEEARRMVAEEMVTVIAHDLGNYLTPIMGRVELMRRRAARDGRDLDVRDAQETASALKRMGRMVHDLMDVGRLEGGIFTLSKKRFDLVALVRETVSSMSTETCPIQAQAYREKIEVVADPDRVRQALENLLSNATKHSPEGAAVRVEVTTEKREDGEWAVISVRDQGPGVSEEMKARLFTRFASGPDSTGLGLGLYLARGVAHAHDGDLIVESEMGKGACFKLTLPITQQ